MNKRLILPLIIAGALSTLTQAAELPKAGSYNAGAQISWGNIDHDSFNNDKDGSGQIMFYVDYYFKDGWAVETAINTGSNVQDWICDNVEDSDDYCANSDQANPNSLESDLDFSNFIVAVRHDRQVSENSFVYGKLGAQYFDYEMKDNSSVFEEDSGTGIFSELGWQYQWSNNLNANIGYQFMGMGDLSTSSLTVGLGYRF
jgi:opacity protein-like surface antigen